MNYVLTVMKAVESWNTENETASILKITLQTSRKYEDARNRGLAWGYLLTALEIKQKQYAS